MRPPADSEVWQGFEEHLRVVESLIPPRELRWTGPAEDRLDLDARALTVKPVVRRGRVGDMRLVLVAAAVLAVIGGIRLVTPPATTGPGDQPTASGLAPTPSSSRPSPSPSPIATRRSIGIAFKEVPRWLVPADGSLGSGGVSTDGYWSQKYDIPRSPVTVLADYRARFAAQGIDTVEVKSGSRTLLSTRGVSPSIIVIVTPNGSRSEVDLSFDRIGS